MARTLPAILRRFRPIAAPGPAAPAGVPVDRVAEADAELAVVFAALASTTTAVDALQQQALSDAARRQREGHEEARRILADARSQLEPVRAEAASARLDELDRERARLEEAAFAEAAQVRESAQGRLRGLVDEVIDEVVRDLHDLDRSTPP